MSILIMTIPVSFTLVLLFLLLFFKANREGDFDDLESPAHNIFLDDIQNEGEKSESTDG